MKRMKKIILIVFTAIMAMTSCVRLGDLGLEPVPDIAFSYTCDGLTLTFTSETPGTENISWRILEVVNGQTEELSTSTGEVFVYEFATPGNYWVQMTGTYNGREQVFSGKILVAKPSAVKLDDETFDDWNEVNYEDFILTGTAAEGGETVASGKMDYDANYIYFYLEVDTTLPSTNQDQAILTMSIDADSDMATGMSDHSMGVDWLLEGNFWSGGWASWYDCSSGETVEDATKAVELGTYKVEGDKMYMEFGLSRNDFNMTGSSAGIFMKFYNEDWNDAILISCQGRDSFTIAMDKLE